MAEGSSQDNVNRAMVYLTWIGVAVGALSVLYAVVAALGYRFGYLDLGPALGMHFAWGVRGALAGLGLILVAGFVLALKAQRFHVFAIVGGVATLAFVIIMVPQILTARQAPPIHDVSTDTENPPPFVAILPLREATCQESRNQRVRDGKTVSICNNPEYEAEPEYLTKYGQSVPRLQAFFYRDIQPIIVEKTPDEVFDTALFVVRKMKLKIVAANGAEGRIEASYTSFWFGFTDDLVIRVRGLEDGTTRLDIRSESRVGRSDVGMNAKRIRSFLARMKEALHMKADEG